MNVFSKEDPDGDSVLTAPDTQFGPGASPDGQVHGSAEAAARRLGNTRARRPQIVADEDENLRLPLIGHMPLARQLRLVLVAFVAGILLTVTAMWQDGAHTDVVSQQGQLAADALMHSQRVAKAAPNALRGEATAFVELDESRAELGRLLTLLARGGKSGALDLPPASGQLAAMLAKARSGWSASNAAASTIVGNKRHLIGFGASVDRLDALVPDLQLLADRLRGGSARDAAAGERLAALSERLPAAAHAFSSPGAAHGDAARVVTRDSAELGALLDSLSTGPNPVADIDLRERLAAARILWKSWQEGVAPLATNMHNFAAARTAEEVVARDNEGLRATLAKAQAEYRATLAVKSSWFWVLVGASVFTLAMGGSLSRVMLQDSRNRTRGAEARRQEAEAMRQLAQAKEEEAKATNDQNQAAILRLMNELQEVADGDLTVHATVSEDITGAIADSVNYTVEELRGLVQRVIKTAEQVTHASGGAQTVSSELLGAAEAQSREIQDASSTVLRMATQISDVSRSATESADVARQSVAAAEQGAQAVQNAILGMNEIREQIQETSKRIKRLGESSQEIGEITDLISDITEQTNVLALNAAIQAASAGEAGRGFSVVAEEVQRLAERSAESAKQIGALVRTIQADTHDAVAAMEKSTQGVVEGARLSDAAGAALSDISRVSNRLAELIQGISLAAEEQATSANGVAHNMQHILSVTEQTQGGTRQTAQSIHELALLAQELKDSVSRFRVAA
ncbi:methyl-accepting chemotaxis protein [Massilia sp. G4R7]|uniref:Methyl-accepting chemotaxis protein n=1 Tax=Massilia phyllostachyos TaxID=2898585 RepID=A0ABS8Q087_9BURK|nr:methyl-accepting chemotaxis protein [Massilia phyllostachyos]MCD2515162.1 methyl-accepting chemotaxis protein [Massilia phyllostachyos]